MPRRLTESSVTLGLDGQKKVLRIMKCSVGRRGFSGFADSTTVAWMDMPC